MIRFLILLMGLMASPNLRMAAQTAPPKKTAFDKATMEAYVRHLFVMPKQVNIEVADPVDSSVPGMKEVKVKATLGAQSGEYSFYVSADGQKIVQGTVYDVAKNPFAADLEKLKTEFQPSFGTPGAPVVLVLFSDFQCPYCKEEAKLLRDNLIKAYPKEVRVYFKDMPLEQIHPWARPASIAGRCVFRQNAVAFWDFHDWIFSKQSEMNAENLKGKVLEWASGKGLNSEQLTACIDNKVTDREIARNMEEAKALRVNQTPTLFINGRRLAGGLDWNSLKTLIDFELDYQKTAKNAGEEACCSVELKTPFAPKP
jgi:protein-disulfide isomerase